MKPFNLTNLDKFNLQCVVAGVTYEQDDFELNNLTTTFNGSSSVTIAEVTVTGRMEDYDRIQAANTCEINIVTSTGIEPLVVMFVKHPVAYNGREITVQLDVAPAAKYVSATTINGLAIPYSFGTPYVKSSQVESRSTGVITESQYGLSLNSVLALFDLYMEAQPAIAAACRGGHVVASSSSADHYSLVSQPQSLVGVARLRAEVDRLKELAPSKEALLDELFAIVFWQGIGEQSFHVDHSFITNGYRLHLDNLGLPPAISAYSLLDNTANSEVLDFIIEVSQAQFSNAGNQAAVDAGYRNAAAQMLFKNNNHPGTSYGINLNGASLSQLNAYYLWLCNQLMSTPSTIKVDLGVAPIANASFDVGGLTVSGSYANGVLSNVTKGPELVNWSFSPSGTTNKVVVSGLNGRSIVGKYLMVNCNIDHFPTYEEPTYTYEGGQPVQDAPSGVFTPFKKPRHIGGMKVLAQDGNVITLSTLPVQISNESNHLDYLDPGDPYGSVDDYFNFPYPHPAFELIRTGTISAISSTLEGATYQGEHSVAVNADTWAIDQNKTVMPMYFASYEAEPDAGEKATPSYAIGYIQGGITSSGIYNGIGKRFLDKEEEDVEELQQRFSIFGSPDTNEQKNIAYIETFEEAEYVWTLTVGDVIDTGDVGTITHIVDFRINIPILEVKAKVGEAYVVVPTAFYTVINNHEVEGYHVTAIQTTQSLSDAGYSNDLFIQVDTGQATVGSMLSPLATTLGKTYNEVVAFPVSIVPAYTVYGATSILEVLDIITEQSRGAYVFSVSELQTKYLNTAPVGAPYAFDESNIESFEFITSDSLDLLNNTVFTVKGVLAFKNKFSVTLENPPEALVSNSTKEIDIFGDMDSALEFAKWQVHREGRNWLRVSLEGFITELHLDALDYVSVSIEGVPYVGEIEGVTFDNTSGVVSFDVILGATLWEVGTDLVWENI